MPERSTIDPMARETNTRSFVLRVDAATMEALEAWAEDEFNGQLQWIIADALRRSGRLKKSRPQAARADASPDKRSDLPAVSKRPSNESGS